MRGAGAFGKKRVHKSADYNDDPADNDGARLRFTDARENLPALVKHVVRSAVDDGFDAEHDTELREDHHGADTAGKAGDDRLGHLGDEAAETKKAEDEQEDGSHHADFGCAALTLCVNSLRDEGHGGAGGAADQNGVAPEQRSNGGSGYGSNQA